MSTKYNQQHPLIINIDIWVFCLILAASCVAGGYWWGSEAQTEVRVIKIPDTVTPINTCDKMKLKVLLHDYRRTTK